MTAALEVDVPYEEPLPDAVAGVDLAELDRRVAAAIAAAWVRFGGSSEPLRVDPVPRVLTEAQWGPVAAGLCQRVRALDRFVADIYGRQCIVRDGVIPATAIGSAAYFEPLMQQAAHDERRFITIAGLDLVRAPDGAFRVIEDNVRTPSGIAYALAARTAVTEALGASDHPPAPLNPSLAYLRRALAAAAPPGVEDPTIALLTDGPGNAAYFDHVTIARRLGLRLVRLVDLRRRGPQLFARADGREIRLDVVYRRTDEDRLQHPRGGLTDVGRLLLEPWVAGRLGLVNAFGTGVADDKLVHAYVEDMIRFYLDEEPLLPSVTTWDLLAPGRLNQALERLETLVVKPRSGPGEVSGPSATRRERDRAAAALRRSPTAYVVQDFVPASTHPTLVGCEPAPRPVGLKAFVASSGREAIALPGGLTRVARGTIKDTWVVPATRRA